MPLVLLVRVRRFTGGGGSAHSLSLKPENFSEAKIAESYVAGWIRGGRSLKALLAGPPRSRL